MTTASPAQLYATLVGAVLVIVGIGGFLYDSSFATGDALTRDDALGILAVNAWHNVLHLLTGLLGLASARSGARPYALAAGTAYLALAIWGFLAAGGGAGALLELIPVNTADNIGHLIVGLAGLAAAATTPGRLAPRASGTA